MPTDQMTNRERAALFVLLAEGREMTNSQLREVAGLTIDGQPRRRLLEERLITADKRGRPYYFEITDRGARWCRDELTSPLPSRPGYLGGALYAVLAALGRNGAPLSELLPARTVGTLVEDDHGDDGDVEDAVRAAYARAPRTPDGWAGLSGLRELLAEHPRSEVDAVLARMASAPGVHLQPEPHQAKLTDCDRADAVVIGGTERHMIKIEAG